MADLGDFLGFSIEVDNSTALFYGFSIENQENIFINFVDQDNNPVPFVDVTYKGIDYITDSQGFIALFTEVPDTSDVFSSKASGFIGDDFVFYESLITPVTVTEQGSSIILTIVMQVLLVEPNLSIRLVNKSFESVFNENLRLRYNLTFDEILNSGSNSIVGPIIIVNSFSNEVQIDFAGNDVYKPKSLLYTKSTDESVKETINFVLEEQPETVAYLKGLTNILLNINTYKIFKARYFGGDCSKIEQISCEIFNLKKEVERLDIDNSQDDLNYFENIKAYIDELLTQIETEKILTTRYFTYDLSSIYVQSRTTSQIVLDWLGTLKNNTNVFIIERSEDNMTFTEVSRGLLSNFTDSELPHNTLYYYRVSIDNADSCTDPLNISARTLHLPIDTFTATTISESQIDLAWTDSNQEGTGFEIQISTDNENFSTLEIIDDITTDTYSAVDLLEGVQYYFRLRVIDTINQNTSDFITANAVTNLITPTNLVATASSNTITLTWEDNTTKEKNYTVEQSLDGIAFVVLTTELARDTITFEVPGLDEETEYFYRVRATSNIAVSEYSNTDSDTTTIAIPTNLALEVLSDTEILVTWDDSSNIEDNYVLERSLDGVTFGTVFNLAPDTVSYNDTGLTPGTMYFYRIKAVNLSYDGDYSPIVSACTTLNNMTID